MLENNVVLVLLLLTLNDFTLYSSAFIVDFEQVNVRWDVRSPLFLWFPVFCN